MAGAAVRLFCADRRFRWLGVILRISLPACLSLACSSGTTGPSSPGSADAGSGGTTGTGGSTAMGAASGMGGGSATGGSAATGGSGGGTSPPDAGTTTCVSSATCGSTAPVCDVRKGVCVQCLRSPDCTTAKAPVCEVAANKCVECLVSSDCTGGRVCNVGDHACAQPCGGGDAGPAKDASTRSDASGPGACSGKTPICDGTRGFCVQCTVSTDCSTSAGSPVCNTKSGKCVECLVASDCKDPTASFCTTKHQCSATP